MTTQTPMMDDRQLLEAAAKAAGIKLVWVDKYDAGLADEHIIDHPNPHWVIDEYPYQKWNPLTDDGDRYRLARDVGLEIGFKHGIVRISGRPHYCQTFTPGDDKSEAYAIVRAAAEMGK